MFRKLSRIKQQLSQEECIEVLKKEPRGVLAVLGDDDYPYALPINFFYIEEENRIYFHSGKIGHKIDALKCHNKASFCVYDQGYHKENHWSLNIRSVIAFGKIRFEEEWSQEMMVDFCKKYTDDMEYIENEIRQFAEKTVVFSMEIEHMTGKLVNES